MVKILAQITCKTCNGRTFVVTDEEILIAKWKYKRQKACPTCNGRGVITIWLDLSEIAQLLDEITTDKPKRKGIL